MNSLPIPVLVPGLALLCALLTGIFGRTLRGGLYAGLVLALSLPLLVPTGDDALTPVRLSELVLPDLWQPLPADVPNLVTLAYDADAPELRAQGSAHRNGSLGSPAASGDSSRLHVGITALCLALMALVGVKGATAWIGRALLVAGLGVVWTVPSDGASTNLPEIGLITTCFGLALLAGLALGSLKPLGEKDPVAAALFLGALAVIVFGGLAGWAAWSGSAEPRDVVAALVERLAAQGAPAPTTLERSATASHLVHVLDHGALAALAAMTALLLHLKGRRLPTAVLVFLVTACELLVVRYGWPFG